MSQDHTHHDHSGHGHHLHVTPFWPMLIVFALLLVLTALTVWTANVHYIEFGNTTIEIGATAHILIALAIAALKSGLVLAYFMHLLYDKAVNTIIVASTLFAIALFIGLTLMDISVRDDIAPVEYGEVVPGGTTQVIDKAAARAEAKKSNEYAGDEAKTETGGADEPEGEEGASDAGETDPM